MRAAVVVLGLVACKYSAPDAVTPGDDAPTPDAAIDGIPIVCEANTKACNGRTLLTCNADGTGIAASVICPLTCDTDHCAQASNLEVAKQLACDATAPSYTATGSSGIAANLDMTCNGCTPIPATERIELGAPDLAYYCVSHFEVPTGLDFNITDGTGAAILIFVAGDVVIDGTIDLDGGSSLGASGAFNGGGTANSNFGQGIPGTGPCAGNGGQSTPDPGGFLNTGDNVGGGGGGGGGSLAGEEGGNGRDNGSVTANGGSGGGDGGGCSTPELIPLVGGSGGGGGGDGACSGNDNSTCGQQGGGGGGAIQIVATGSITIGATGQILAPGGNGGSNTGNDGPGGGGGGGGGGSVLLEASTLSILGSIQVNGGSGGNSAGRAGGAGGTTTTAAGAGVNFTANGQGGSGGGGGLGRVRLNGKTGATCPAATFDPCTSAGLTPTP